MHGVTVHHWGMMLLWNFFKAMNGRQLLWTAICVLSLLENQVDSDTHTTVITTSSAVSSSTVPNVIIPKTTTVSTKETAGKTISSATITTATKGTSDLQASPEKSKPVEDNNRAEVSNKFPDDTRTTSAAMNVTQQPLVVSTLSPAQENATHVPSNNSIQNITSGTLMTSIKPTKLSFTGSHTPSKAAIDIMANFTCVNIRQINAPEVICLELNEAYSCQDFIKVKGKDFTEVVCERKSAPCTIKLADSRVNHNCILLLEVGKKDVLALDADLQQQKTALNELGIKFHKQSTESHQKHARKTLIALVTTGLLLAFLGLAGYFLMKRRSWSPMGERLGEDPYYTENGSGHGNTVISVSSHEQADVQEKPNLNGGARENGTGQPTSKNGHSARPHVVADTEL